MSLLPVIFSFKKFFLFYLRFCSLQVKCELVEGHQEELKRAKEKLELMKQESRDREAGWKVAREVLKREAEEERTLALLQLREQAEAETQSLVTRFELRELEMRRLQDQQAAQIRDLEESLLEQQGRLRQLELGLAGEECPQCGGEPGGRPADQGGELAMLRLKEDCALQLMQAQNRWVALSEQALAIEPPVTFLPEVRPRHPPHGMGGRSPGRCAVGFQQGGEICRKAGPSMVCPESRTPGPHPEVAAGSNRCPNTGYAGTSQRPRPDAPGGVCVPWWMLLCTRLHVSFVLSTFKTFKGKN